MRPWRKTAFGLFAMLVGAGALAQDMVTDRLPLSPVRVETPVVASTPAKRGPEALTKEDVDAWLDGYMPYAVHSGDISGAVVTVVKDGQILSAKGYGYANIDKRQPVDPERTLFRPGSVSKLITWTAVMQMVEQGKLDLDRDVNSYLDFKIPPRDGQPITLRQIMTHTAGFEEATKDIILADAKDVPALDAYLKRWVPARIYPAGTTPAYSNWATCLAAYMVQRASGMAFNDYVDRNIFAPLGMAHSTFRQPLPKNLAPFMAVGYPQASLPAQPFENVGPFPAGSLSSSGTDMARFMLAHLGNGELNGRRILQPATAMTMHNSPLNRVNPRSLIPPLNRMELGFFETNVNGREVIAHLGDLSNFHTSLHLFMADGVGIYFSFSSAGKAGSAHTLRAALFQDFADRYFPSTARDGRVDPKTSAQHARMMAGLWQNSRRSETNWLAAVGLIGQTKVSVGPKGELMVPDFKGPEGAPRHWVEIAPFVWRDRDSDDRIAAQVQDGKVVRWSMDLISPFMVFDRVPAGISSAWILPALYASLGILALTFLYWPAAWYVRRRYAAPLRVSGRERTAYRGTRIASGLVLAVLIGWIALVSVMLNNLGLLSGASDPWLWLLQIIGLIVFVGAVLVTGWNAWLTWRSDRGWRRKLWNTLVFLAALMVLYFAFRFGLIALTVNY